MYIQKITLNGIVYDFIGFARIQNCCLSSFKNSLNGKEGSLCSPIGTMIYHYLDHIPVSMHQFINKKVFYTFNIVFVNGQIYLLSNEDYVTIDGIRYTAYSAIDFLIHNKSSIYNMCAWDDPDRMPEESFYMQIAKANWIDIEFRKILNYQECDSIEDGFRRYDICDIFSSISMDTNMSPIKLIEDMSVQDRKVFSINDGKKVILTVTDKFKADNLRAKWKFIR